MPSRFSEFAPLHHEQPFPWCSQIPKGKLSNNLNSRCYSPSALCHARHGGELRVANTTTGKLSDWRMGGSALCPPVCPPWGPVSARAMPSTPGWGDTGEGWGWAWTVPAPHQPGFLMADRPSGCCFKLFTSPCTVCQGQKGLVTSFGAGLGGKYN